MEASELRRVKELEAENAKLKRMYAELALDNAAMKDLIAKNCRAGAEARGGTLPPGGAPAAAAPVLRHGRAIPRGLVSAAIGLDGARCGDHLGAGRAGQRPAGPGLLEVPEAAEAAPAGMEPQADLSG